MPIKFSRPLTKRSNSVALRLLLMPMFVGFSVLVSAGSAAFAASACQLSKPIFDAEASKAVVTINCVDTATDGFVAYPTTPFFVGMSVFEENIPNRTLVRARGREYFVAPVEVELDGSSKSFEFSLGDIGKKGTHYVIAAWLNKTECVHAKADVCFGPYDKYFFPIPLDTYPRPLCNVEALKQDGYFDEVIQQLEYGLGIENENVNCVQHSQSQYGLGLSLYSWRVAPISVGSN